MTTVVRDQPELDRALALWPVDGDIRLVGSATFTITDGHVTAGDRVVLYASGGAVVATDEAWVIASHEACVDARDRAIVDATGRAEVWAYDRVIVNASGRAEIWAHDRSRVRAIGHCRVGAAFDSTVWAAGQVEVDACDRATVYASGRANVVTSYEAVATLRQQATLLAMPAIPCVDPEVIARGLIGYSDEVLRPAGLEAGEMPQDLMCTCTTRPEASNSQLDNVDVVEA